MAIVVGTETDDASRSLGPPPCSAEKEGGSLHVKSLDSVFPCFASRLILMYAVVTFSPSYRIRYNSSYG